MADNKVVCSTRKAATTALETIAGILPRGIQRDSIIAVIEWINGNYPPDYTEETKQRILKIFEGTEWEQKGRAWIEKEMNDPAYEHGTPAATSGTGSLHFLHKMINEPEDGAELTCFWNAETKAWQPCEAWPQILQQTEGIETDEDEGDR